MLPGARHRDDGPLTLGEGLEALARLVPPGHAVSYGGLAGLLGAGGPRQAGRAMAESSPGTPWWRVVRADGSLPPELAARAAVEPRAGGHAPHPGRARGPAAGPLGARRRCRESDPCDRRPYRVRARARMRP
nr:MGMT family protein [Micrococcus luteus]